MTHPDTLTSNSAAILPLELRAIDPVLNRGRKEVAFIDASIANYTTLVDGVQAGVEVVLLNADQDGVAQMALWAKTHSGYDAVHVLSHGSDGALKLGNMTLTSVNLNRYNAELAEIGKSLNPQGDILIYGCNLAQGTAGAQFIGQLAQITNADVAASKDNTGAVALGGNWTLELSTGAIETMGLPQVSEPFSRFGGLLALIRPDLSSGSDTGSSYSDDITKIDTPVFTGKSGANFSIVLYDTNGTTELGTTTADGSGAWSITSSKLTEGDHSITAKMTDIGGSSTTSSALVVTVDITAPSASNPNLAPASDSGSSDSDGITTVTTPTLTGTTEAYALVNLFDSNGKIVLGTTTASASGDWSIVSSALSATTHYVTSKVTDIAGNVSTASSKVTVVVDTVSPTLASDITISDTALKIGDTATVKFAFLEAVTGFETIDLTVSNGTLSSLTTSDSGKNWTATLSPAASTTVDSNVITLDYTGITDLAGNAGTSTATSKNYSVDTVRPSLASSITINDTALKIGDTATVTFTFTEAVTGFTTDDLSAANGTLTNLNTSDAGITWTASLAPLASTTSATNVITLDNTGYTDLNGNAGSGTTDSSNYAVDTQRPTATIVVADNNLTVGETSLVTLTFSEAIIGLTNADLAFDNGSLTPVSSSDGGITWAATLTPSASTTEASNVITLDYTGIADLADNAGTGTVTSDNYVVDTVSTPPSISNLSGDNVVWAGVGNYASLDIGANATVSNTNFEALNAGNGEWNIGSQAATPMALARTSSNLSTTTVLLCRRVTLTRTISLRQ
jgi:hypothetical protein